MTIPTNNDLNVTTDKVLDLAAQLSNDGTQPSQQDDPNQEQRVPYDRFKEVNDERKNLQDQNQKLMEMMQNYQNMQAQAQQTVQQPQPPTVQTTTSLFTEDELNSFEQDIVLDPKATLQRFGNALMDRGVDSRVKALEESFNQKLQQVTGQMTAQTLPTVIDNFKRSRFNAQTDTAEMAAFDQALQGLDPTLLGNPATLENVRLAAIGYVADQRRSNPQQNQQVFFSETPGGSSGLPGGWGGLGGQPQAPQIPAQVIEAARKMGVDPKEAAAMYQAMNTSGVFRGS